MNLALSHVYAWKVGYRLLCEANTILMELKWIYILKNDIKEDCFT